MQVNQKRVNQAGVELIKPKVGGMRLGPRGWANERKQLQTCKIDEHKKRIEKKNGIKILIQRLLQLYAKYLAYLLNLKTKRLYKQL